MKTHLLMYRHRRGQTPQQQRSPSVLTVVASVASLILPQETWFRAFSVLHQFLFGANVVRSVGIDWVRALVLVRHRTARCGQTFRLETCGIDHRQPLEVLFALMGLLVAVSEVVLVHECAGEADQPQIVIKALAQPYAAGVLGVGGFVACSVRRRGEILRGSVSPVACVEQLAGFQYHLDNVFVNVVLRAHFGVPIKEEYVHLGTGAGTAGGGAGDTFWVNLGSAVPRDWPR